jgi:hypothetical protein
MRPGLHLLIPFLALLPAGCRFVEEVVPIGYKGPARSNSLLAAERFLNERGAGTGFLAENRLTLSAYPSSYSSALVIPGSAFNTQRTVDRALEWASEGGHLIYVARFRDWNNHDRTTIFDLFADFGSESGALFLQALNVETGPASGTPPLTLRGNKKLNIDFATDPWFVKDDLPSTGVYRAGTQGPTPFLSFPYEGGRITLLTDIDGWKNTSIANKDNAAYLWQTVNLAGQWGEIQNVIFIRSSGLSFLALLWHNAWMPLISVTALLIFWLWKCLLRTGPIRQPPEGIERQFLSHIRMGGRLLWHHRQGDVLLDSIRDEIREQMTRRHFQGTTPREERLCEALAERSGLPLDRVKRAMTPARIEKGTEMIDISRDLQSLQSHL